MTVQQLADKQVKDRNPLRRNWKWIALAAVLVVGAAVVGLVWVSGRGEPSLDGADTPRPTEVPATLQPTPIPTPTPRVVIKEVIVEVIKEVIVEKEVIKEVLVTPTPTPIPMPAPPPPCEAKPLDPEKFGKIIFDEGLERVQLIGGDWVNAAFLFHLKEGARQGADETGTDNEVAVALALCDDRGKLVSTVMVRNYQKGKEFEYAEVVQYFEEAPAIKYTYDREQVKVTMTWQLTFGAPVKHVLNPKARIGGLKLSKLILYPTNGASFRVEVDLSDKGGGRFEIVETRHTAITRMEDAFKSLKFVLDQIEAKRE